MKQKSANELIGIQGDFFDFIVSLPVPVSESNLTVINADDPVIWYGNPVSVTAKILQYLLGACKRALYIGDPFGFWKRINQLFKCLLRLKSRCFFCKDQLVF